MAWQDELIELETKLASGALSAEEYRRARDELFARSQSSSAPAESPAQTPPQQRQQPEPPVQPEQGQPPVPQPPPAQQPPQPPPGQQPPAQQGQQRGGPFPPPFQWGKPGTQSDDSTQIIRPVEGRPSGEDERTQIVRDSDPERPQAVSDPKRSDPKGSDPMGSDPERTQTVTGVGPQRPPQGPRSGPTGWTDEEAPPWAGADSTPVIAPNTTWMKQGPESFESGQAKRGRLVGTVVAGVLVVALAVVAIIYFTNNGSTPESATPQGQAPAAGEPTSSAPPPLPAPPPPKPAPKSGAESLVDPPGALRQGGGPIKKGELAQSTSLAPNVLNALGKAGFVNGVLKATTDKDVNIGAFALSVRNKAAATQVAQAYGSVQTEGGIPARRADSMQGVAAYGTPDDSDDSARTRRAVYVLYQRVIIIDVSGPDRQRVEDTFKTLLQRQVAFAPPTERQAIP